MRLNTIGDLSKLPKDLVKTIEDWKQKSKKNKNITVTIALNYGGRDEIIRAINKAINKKLDNLTIREFANLLDTSSLPDPDLIIRTGGANRLSGFLLWQSEYAELYFTNTLMPDFTVKEFNKALKEFSRRQRRFGK
jgi:undecaprenyl diphosphate synthase